MKHRFYTLVHVLIRTEIGQCWRVFFQSESGGRLDVKES